MFTLVARVPQGYKVVRYNAFRYLDLKKGSDGAHLIASVKPFQTLGPEYEMHFWLGLHTAKGEAVRYHNRYQRNDTVF